MKIAMISAPNGPHTDPVELASAGWHQHFACLAEALAELGHEVRLYLPATGADPARTGPDAAVSTVPVPVPAPAAPGRDGLLPYLRSFGRWLGGNWQQQDWTPDLVHSHFWMGGVAALVARAMVGRQPVVQTFHGTGHRGNPAPESTQASLRRLVGQQAERVIAESGDEVTELVRLGVPRSRITLAPSGIDTDTYRPSGPAMPRTADRPRILAVGRLADQHGFLDLIRALRRIPSAELVLLGGPPAAQLATDPEADRLREVAERTGVADRVRLMGAVPVTDLPQWYRSADVLACTPWYEPEGLAALEGMACGTPVVASAVGPLAEAVVDRVTGDLIPPGDPDTAGDALRRLLADPVRRLGYGVAGADRARQRFRWSRTATQISRVYEHLWDGAGARSATVPT